MSLFNVIHLDFKAPVPVSHKFFNSLRKTSFLVASLTNFAPRKILERIVIADEKCVHHDEPERKA
jgi:hypothetical protein